MPRFESGEPNVGAPGSGGHGTVVPGRGRFQCGMSREFSKMILEQRVFQASSRIHQGADEFFRNWSIWAGNLDLVYDGNRLT